LRDRGEHEPVFGYNAQLCFIVGDAAPAAAERKSGADYYGIADFQSYFKRPVEIVCNSRGNDWLSDFDHRVTEKLPVLGLVNGLG